MMNYSKDSEYHTQINNKSIPEAACNTTSIIMAAKQAGHKCDFGEGQPEDRLTDLLLTPKYWHMMDNLNPQYKKNGYRPNEIHDCLCAATNELFGDIVDSFSTNTPVLRIKNHLTSGGGVVLSGRFKLSNGETWNHIVSLAGYDEDGYLIDDPRGDFRTNYKDKHGNDIFITKDEFFTIFKGGEDYKWAHLVSKK